MLFPVLNIPGFSVLVFCAMAGWTASIPVHAVDRTTYRINCGGPAFDGPRWVDTVPEPGKPTDTARYHWEADGFFTGGGTYSQPHSIANTGSQPLFQTERWTPDGAEGAKYSFPVPAGSYALTLYFAEISPEEAAVGMRVFNVRVNGIEMLHHYDIFAKAGSDRATSETKVVKAVGGKIEISFENVAHHAKISAIQILPAAVTGIDPVEGTPTKRIRARPFQGPRVDASGRRALRDRAGMIPFAR
ncbi:MAG: hypothetical protein JWP91_468 [Fibrobacteres bacterium]|nr:hypothetical protein [Fibrobacterota bacterium]